MTENTVDTDVYEQRHQAALEKISAALTAQGDLSEQSELEERLEAMSREKASLEEKLEGLEAQRTKDMAELDDLISQLKPLIGDV